MKKKSHDEILGKPWEIVETDMFILHNKYYLCIFDYFSKFPVIKMTEDLSADSLMLACKIIFSEYGLPKKIMSDASGNFISDKFKRFCHSLTIEQAVSSSHHHESNGQVEVCIKFPKHTIKKCLDTKSENTYSFIAYQINTARTRTTKPCNAIIQSLNKRHHTNNEIGC